MKSPLLTFCSEGFVRWRKSSVIIRNHTLSTWHFALYSISCLLSLLVKTHNLQLSAPAPILIYLSHTEKKTPLVLQMFRVSAQRLQVPLSFPVSKCYSWSDACKPFAWWFGGGEGRPSLRKPRADSPDRLLIGAEAAMMDKHGQETRSRAVFLCDTQRRCSVRWHASPRREVKRLVAGDKRRAAAGGQSRHLSRR